MSVRTQRDTPAAGRAEMTGDYVWASPSRPPRERLNGAIVFVIAAALIAAVGMLYLLQTNHIARLGYEMSRLQEQRGAALVEQQQLAAQIARRQSLAEVEATARRDLGLRPMEQYLFLDVELPEEQTAPESPPAPDAPSAWQSFLNRLAGRGSAGESGDEGGGR